MNNRPWWHCLASIAVGTALIGTVALAPTGAARADGDQEQLMPDPDAYCVANAPYQAQVNEAGWTVQYSGLSGLPGQNDWACNYDVVADVPTPYGDGGAYILPPHSESFPIDWAAMCAQQYEASTVQWVGVPGPLPSPGPFGSPWMCLGAPGATYDQSETINGPVGRTG